MSESVGVLTQEPFTLLPFFSCHMWEGQQPANGLEFLPCLYPVPTDTHPRHPQEYFPQAYTASILEKTHDHPEGGGGLPSFCRRGSLCEKDFYSQGPDWWEIPGLSAAPAR